MQSSGILQDVRRSAGARTRPEAAPLLQEQQGRRHDGVAERPSRPRIPEVKGCPIPGCRERVSDNYFMCSRHWRLVPPEVRKAWSITLRQYNSMPTQESARATIENK